MNFEQRKSAAIGLVMDFLQTFVPPRGLDDDAVEKIVLQIADAFARKMPAKGEFAEHCDKVFQKVRDTHQSNTWPTQAVFVMAMPSTGPGMAPAQETFAPSDRLALIANAMSEDRGVSEAAIWSPQHISVSPDVLQSYRVASVRNWVDAYRSEAQAMMQEKYGSVVLPFFSQAMEAAE